MRFLAALAFFLPAAAFAQTAPVVVQAAPTVDLTGIAVSAIGAIATIMGTVISFWLRSRMNNQDDAVVLGNAVRNSLGAIQQAATTAVEALKPSVVLPGVTAQLAPGVQYVLDHAGDEAKRLNITPAAIADKIDAQIGLAKIAASGAAPAVPAPGQAVPPPPIRPVVPPPPIPPVVPAPSALIQPLQGITT